MQAYNTLQAVNLQSMAFEKRKKKNWRRTYRT